MYSRVHILSKHICQNCWETVKNLVYKWCKSAPVEWESTLGKHSFFFHKEEDAYSLDWDKWTINIFIIQFVSFPTRRYYNACIFGPFGILLSCTVNLFLMYSFTQNIFNHLYSRKVSSSIPGGHIVTMFHLHQNMLKMYQGQHQKGRCIFCSFLCHRYELESRTVLWI